MPKFSHYMYVSSKLILSPDNIYLPCTELRTNLKSEYRTMIGNNRKSMSNGSPFVEKSSASIGNRTRTYGENKRCFRDLGPNFGNQSTAPNDHGCDVHNFSYFEHKCLLKQRFQTRIRVIPYIL